MTTPVEVTPQTPDRQGLMAPNGNQVAPMRKFANPAPLGLCAFALTTFVLSLVNMKTRGVTTPNVVVGLAFGYGGLAQLLAGMWEFAVGNTFGATAFSSYGAFWLSWAFIQSPWSGIVLSYTSKSELNAAVGFYLFGWFIFTGMMFSASFRSSLALSAVFGFLTMTFLLLGIGHVLESGATNVAGGAFGIITAFIAWYVALAALHTPEYSPVSLPTVPLSKV